MAKLPKGYSKAFAVAKAMGKDTFTLDGKTYKTVGGRTHGKSMEELRGEKKSEKAKAGASNPPTQENTKNLSRPKPRPKPTRPRARPDRGPSASDGPSMSPPSADSTSTNVSRSTDRRPVSTPKSGSRLDTPSMGTRSEGTPTKKTTRNPVNKKDITTYEQWKELSRMQRIEAGLPTSVLGAKRYFMGK